MNIGQHIFNKFNQLVVQPNSLVNPSVYTFTKDDMMFVVESGGAGLMGHSHELYEIVNEDENKDIIIRFKMARTYLHEHDLSYFIEKNGGSYVIRSSDDEKVINSSCETMLHSHSLKIREIFLDTVRIFSDYRDIQVISNDDYIFEIQIDEGVLLEHIHEIIKIDVPYRKKIRNAEVVFVFKENMFHGHEGMFYIEKDDDEFMIKHDKRIVDKTTLDNKIGKHDHNIKLVRVTERKKNKTVLLEDPVPDHVAHEIYHVAKMLLQLT